MKRTKRCLPLFSFYDRTGIEKYLEKQALKGWKLSGIQRYFWRFEKTDPQKLHYAVAYLPSASAFDPEPTQAQQQLADFCRHTGWQQAAYSGEMQIFYHEGADPVPIETDALLEVENIHRAMKKSYLPGTIILFFLGVLQMTMFAADWLKSPVKVLTQHLLLYRGMLALVLLVLGAVEVGGYALWRRRAKAAAETDGSFVETRGHQRLQWLLLTLILALFAGNLLMMEGHLAALTVFSIGYVMLIYALVWGVTAYLKKKKAPGEMNKTLTIVAAVVLSMVMIGILPFLSFSAFFPEKESQQTAPLLPSDYFDAEDVAYEISLDEAQSLLLGRSTYYIYPEEIGRESPGTSYVIYDTPFEWAYNLCLRELLAEDSYQLIDAQHFDAQASYRQYWGELPIINGNYIVCYEDRIVLLIAGTELTDVQMRQIGEKLKP